jgi:hypothetical protein
VIALSEATAKGRSANRLGISGHERERGEGLAPLFADLSRLSVAELPAFGALTLGVDGGADGKELIAAGRDSERR